MISVSFLIDWRILAEKEGVFPNLVCLEENPIKRMTYKTKQ